MRTQSGIRIVIVNYQTADLVIECLRSLSKQIPDFSNISVVVIDNNSGDDSAVNLVAAIKREDWSSWSEVVPLARNGGFSFGNNVGIRRALAQDETVDLIMLLNPDTVTHSGAIKSLVDFMVARPHVGIAGSRLENADGGVDCSAHTFHSPLSQLDEGARLGVLSKLLRRYVVTLPSRDVAHACDWVSGASMIIRRQVIEDIGFLDEGYFLYFEEVDYCLRAHQAGWECWYVPESRVLHLEGAATGIRASSKRRAGYWYDSRRRYFVKHYGVTGLVAADTLWAFGRLLFLIRSVFFLCSIHLNNDPKWFMFDLFWGDIWAIVGGQTWRISRSARKL